jgi:hypothetical protein
MDRAIPIHHEWPTEDLFQMYNLDIAWFFHYDWYMICELMLFIHQSCILSSIKYSISFKLLGFSLSLVWIHRLDFLWWDLAKMDPNSPAKDIS